MFDLNVELDCSSTHLPCRKKRRNYDLRSEHELVNIQVNIQNNFPTVPTEEQDLRSPVQVADNSGDNSSGTSGESEMELVHGRLKPQTRPGTNDNSSFGQTMEDHRLTNKELEARA